MGRGARQQPETFDTVILGAGIYGLYTALICARAGERVLVAEYEREPFTRATFVNQARLHMGYHYPRSLATALKTAEYFERFNHDFSDCISRSFDQVYAMSSDFSWTSAEQFRVFCERAGIPCEEVPAERYFKRGMVGGAFLAKEYTYDAKLLKRQLLRELAPYENVELRFCQRLRGVRVAAGSAEGDGARASWCLAFEDGDVFCPRVINATYASVNELSAKAGLATLPIKYELCEIILCDVCEELEETGITVMDGPFFSLMPFGKTGHHSLTSVTFTPHRTCLEDFPAFPCQAQCPEGFCSPRQLGNCDFCEAQPPTAWGFMERLARKYLRKELDFSYLESHFSVKPILRMSEVDDSRPTVVREQYGIPSWVSVLSGKVSTVYDLDALCGGNERASRQAASFTEEVPQANA